MAGSVVFDGVWKKFSKGERHDSLRDLIPTMARRALRLRPSELSDHEFWALRDVSFEVQPGEAFGIIGPNGAGKSTTLKLLTRILKPTRGRCEVRGRVGALIEVAAGFHPDLTGRENVYLQGAIMGMKRAEIAREFDAIVDFAGISAFIDTPVKRYSSGMNARLGFSIAAHFRASVLIIDEVLSVGDMAFQRQCIQRMQTIRREGATIVFVSHNLSAVRLLCSRSMLIDGGQVVVQGGTAPVLERYVAGTLPGSVASPSRDTGARVTAAITAVEIPHGRQMLALKPADEIAVSMRCSLPLPMKDLVLVTYVVQQETDAVAHNSNRVLGHLPQGSSSEVQLDVRLKLNLARGVYALNFSIFNPRTQQHLVWLRPAAVFGIEDPESYSGVAHLDVRVDASTFERAEVVA